MNGRHNAQSISPRALVGRHIAGRCLPILGTGIFIFWLAGGFPPRAWRSLIQTYVRFHALAAGQSGALLSLLFILIIQSLFVVVAWGLLGWMAICEGRKLVEILSETSPTHAATPSKTGKATSPQIAQGPLAIDQHQSMDSVIYASQTLKQLEARRQPPIPVAQNFDEGQNSGALLLPFEEKKLWSYGDEELGNPFASRRSLPVEPEAQQRQKNDQAQSSSSKKINGIGRLSPSPSGYRGDFALFPEDDQLDDMAVNLSVSRKHRISTLQQYNASRLGALHTTEEQQIIDHDTIRQNSAALYSAQESGQYPALKDDGEFSSLLEQIGFLPDPPVEPVELVQPAQTRQTPPDEEPIQPKKKAPSAGKPSRSSKTGVQSLHSIEERSGDNSTPSRVNPFDVQKDVLDMFLQENASVDPTDDFHPSAPLSKPPNQARKRSKQSAEAKPNNELLSQNSSSNQPDESIPPGDTPSQAYVFGNPFDGPLPDIFKHDESLKQAIVEQNNRNLKSSVTEEQPQSDEEKKPVKRRRRNPKASSSSL